MTAYEIMKISEHETGPGSEGTKTTEGEGEPKERHPENRRTCQEADDLGTEHMNIAATRKLNPARLETLPGSTTTTSERLQLV